MAYHFATPHFKIIAVSKLQFIARISSFSQNSANVHLHENRDFLNFFTEKAEEKFIVIINNIILPFFPKFWIIKRVVAVMQVSQ